MLKNLYLNNFALFEKVNIDFEEGLNILSGETGSGKSILISALSMLVGGKVNKDYIGKFSNETLVEAAFDTNEKINYILKEHDIEFDDTVIITRKFSKTSSSIKVNSRQINLTLLEKISSNLLDIHGQHSQLIALNKSNYLSIIDSFERKTNEIKNKLRDNLKNITYYQKTLKTYDIDDESLARELDLLDYQIKEIESFDFDKFDEDILVKEHKKLTNQSTIIKTIANISSILGSNSYARKSIKDSFDSMQADLISISEYDIELEKLLSNLIDIKESINDFSKSIESYYYSINLDENRIKVIEELFKEIGNLRRKYGNDNDTILAYYDKAIERRKNLKNIDALREKLKTKINNLNLDNIDLCNQLNEIRINIINKLENRIVKELQEMNMDNICFSIKLQTIDKINENGNVEIDFMISTNKGQDLKSLSQVASGGEISRFMLALKATLADIEKVNTLIFDEIDTGISGKTADIVGDKLLKIAQKRQLIVITHLAQIASKANSHYLISKYDYNYMTRSSIDKLSFDQKINEVARLISGSNITNEALAGARQLIMG